MKRYVCGIQIYKLEYHDKGRDWKKMKNTAKLEASVARGAPGSTHDAHASKRCPSIKHDAQGSTYDAQSITCDAQASRRCPSIHDDPCKRVNGPSHEPMTSHHPKQHTQTQKLSSTCKYRETSRNAKFPKALQSPSSKNNTGPKSYITAESSLQNALSLPHGVEEVF